MVKDCAGWNHHRIDCPQEPLDWVLLGAAIAAAIPFIFANGVVFAYRERQYFKAQGGVFLILKCSVAGLIWIVSTFVVNNHFYRTNNKGLQNCALWFFWLQICLGFCPWWICIIMRLHKMHNMYKKAKESLYSVARPENHSWVYISWGLTLIPPIILCTVATKVPKVFKGTTHCDLTRQWKLGTFLTVPPLYFSVFFVFLCRLRKHRDTLLNREYRHTCDTANVAFILYLLIGTTYITQGYRRVTGRCFLTFCICCLVFHHFWHQMWWPVYLCLFRTRTEMDRYEDEKGGTIVRLMRLHNSKFNVPCEEALFAACAELAIPPDRINSELAEIEDLKRQKVELLTNIRKLKEQLSQAGNNRKKSTT